MARLGDAACVRQVAPPPQQKAPELWAPGLPLQVIAVTPICDCNPVHSQVRLIFFSITPLDAPPSITKGLEACMPETIAQAIRKSLLAMEQSGDCEFFVAIQFVSAIDLAHELHYHIAVYRDQSDESMCS